MWALAIDYGTSRSAGAMFADGAIVPLEVEGNRWMPSLVLLDPSGAVLVGTAADNQAGVYPDRVERTPKRQLGSPAPLVLGDATLDAEDAAAAVLRVFLDEGKLRRGGEGPAEVVLTHPVRWADERKQALLRAAAKAGLPEPLLIEEPVAAAIHYVSDQVAVGQYVAIYDLGGGTFDTAVLRRTEGGFEVVGSPGGDEYIGGEDFDHRLYRYFGDNIAEADAELWELLCTSDERKYRRAALDLIVQSRRAKEALSSWTSTQVFVPIADRDFMVNRSQFEAMIIDDVERTVDLMDDTIASAGISIDDISALYLVGGSSRTPLIVQLLTERFGERVTTRDEPKSVVALGAAKVAGALALQAAAPVAAPADAAVVTAPAAATPAWPTPTSTPTSNAGPEPIVAGAIDAPPPDPSQMLAPASATVEPVRPVALGDALQGLRRLGDRARAALQALAAAPTVGVPAPPVGQPPAPTLLPGTPQRMPSARWRQQYSRPIGHLCGDADAVFFALDNGELHALRTFDGAPLWSSPVGALARFEPVLHGSALLCVTADHHALAVDRHTGAPYWRAPLNEAPAAPLLAAGNVAFAVTAGGIISGLAMNSGTAGWRFSLGLPIRSAVLLSSQEAAVAATDGTVMSIDLLSGAVRWRVSAPAPGNASIGFVGNLAVAAGVDGRVAAIEPASGALRWVTQLPAPALGAACGDASLVFVVTGDGHLNAIDAASGVLRWRLAGFGASCGGATYAQGAIHVDTGNGQLQVLEAATAQLRWHVATGQSNSNRPLRAGAIVLIATPQAQLYALVDQG